MSYLASPALTARSLNPFMENLFMHLRQSLYRRLGRWITCEFEFSRDARLGLRNRYEVESFKDVFCHFFYWQVFGTLKSAPRYIVDCGANCGHFAVLADQTLRRRFPDSTCEFLLIEPNPRLAPVLRRTLRQAHLNARVVPAVVGAKPGQQTLWIHPRTYMTASLEPFRDARPFPVQQFDLAAELRTRPADLLKLDIEGAEFQLLADLEDQFERINALVLEIHGPLDHRKAELEARLARGGFHAQIGPLPHFDHELAFYTRQPR